MTKKHPDVIEPPEVSTEPPAHAAHAGRPHRDHHGCDVHSRYEKLPAGFTRYRGKGCPFPDKALVEVMIRTDEGLGSGSVQPAFAHDWKIKPTEINGIVGHRLVGKAPDGRRR